MRDSMVFYRSFYEALRDLDNNTKAILYDAIFDYGLNFKEPELTGIAKTVFTLIRPQLDANIRKFDNGSKGGRPQKEEPKDNLSETKEEPKQNQSESKAEANVNANANANGNGNSNENFNQKVKAFNPPEVDDVVICFASTMAALGLPNDAYGGAEKLGHDFHNYYHSQGWKKANDLQITEWRPLIPPWLAKEKSYAAKSPKPNNQQSPQKPERSWNKKP